MQVTVRFTSILLIAFAVWLTAAWSCSEVTDMPSNYSEQRLRSRIALAWSHIGTGDFEAYVSMSSQKNRRDIQALGQDPQKSLQMWQSILRMKPIFRLLDLKISGEHAKAKVQASYLEESGSRTSNVEYEYWVFENGDWFLDDAGRTE